MTKVQLELQPAAYGLNKGSPIRELIDPTTIIRDELHISKRAVRVANRKRCANNVDISCCFKRSEKHIPMGHQ